MKIEILEKLKAKDSRELMARAIRLVVIQQQYKIGNLTENDAKELLSGPLSPGDINTIFNDSDQLILKEEAK